MSSIVSQADNPSIAALAPADIPAEAFSPSRLRKREQLLEQLFSHCSVYGYRRSSMDAIAEAAGISRTALYYYFSNKDAVFAALCEWFYARIDAELQSRSLNEQVLDLALLRALETRAKAFVSWVSETPHGRAMVRLNGPFGSKQASDRDQQFRRRITARLELALGTGELDANALNMSSTAACDLLIACCDGLWAAQSDGPDWPALRQRLSHLIRAMLLAWGGRPSYTPKFLQA